MHKVLKFLAALSVAAASPSIACSVVKDYRVPTNLELASKADVILLARVESGSTKFTSPTDMAMTVTPIEVLKGDVPIGKPLILPGSLAEPRFAVLSNPLELEAAHPLAYIGGCTRYMFVRGATVLFFLTPAEKLFDGDEMPPQMKGMLVQAGGAFSRWAEDVLSADSPWVRATRIYIKAAALPADQQKALLVAERDRLRAGDQESKVIADDIDRQLAGPNKSWNQLMEEEIKKAEAREKRMKEATDALDSAAEALEKEK